MNARSLRFRLVVWYVASLTLVFVGFAALVYFASRHYLVSSLRDVLSRRAHQAAEIIQTTGSQPDSARFAGQLEGRLAPVAFNRFLRISLADGRIVYASGPPTDSSFDPMKVQSPHRWIAREDFRRELTADGDPMFLFCLPVEAHGGKFLVEFGSASTPVDLTLSRMLFVLAIAIPVLVLVAASGGYILVERALRPVDEVIRTAEKIRSNNLDDRLPVPQTGDEIQRLSIALNDMIRRLDEAFQQKRQFMADASHELRTPLTVMAAELEEIMGRSDADDEVRQLARQLLEEVKRLARIVAGLLVLSRLDARESLAAPVQFDLGNQVRDTVEQMAVLAAEKGQSLQCTVAGLATVEADPSQIKQVTVNLIDNAIKYTQAGGRIDVRVVASSGVALLEVSDNGPGIPREALSRVFDRFFQVNKVQSRELGGAGLGLSIVKSICTANRGSVQVENLEVTGARFRVSLPLA